jgi:hypothetical protein
MFNIVGIAIKKILKTPEWDRFITSISKINIRFGYHGFKASNYLKIKDALSADPLALYAFCSLEKNKPAYKIENIALGSKYSHCGIVLRGTTPDDITLVHVEGNGLHVEHILDIIDKVDEFLIVKLPIAENNLDKARERVLTAIEKKNEYSYDKTFDLDNEEKKVYCSEFVYNIGEGLVDDKDFKPKWCKGIKMFSPDTIPDCGTKVF